MSTLIGVMKPILSRAAYRALVDRSRSTKQPETARFTRADVNRILNQVWRNFDQLAPSIPQERTLGARMNVTLAGMTVAFYSALLAEGVEPKDSIQLTNDTAWVIYKRWGILPRLLSLVLARTSTDRLRVCTDLFRRFPFNPPSYIMEDLLDKTVISFNVTRCPVAEYFRSQRLRELCVGSWCNQDYALAEMWGGKLERKHTLAAGDEYCDFRWTTANSGIDNDGHGD
ncbi:MAG: L-2-amino-thiazoline-4-carboxylic acid hydrolase [Anaerolineae bacterium]|nr:L-2-amino-thiazoline-4-carboxylic acid hydrolase [Anaerolineae bacterium]